MARYEPAHLKVMNTHVIYSEFRKDVTKPRFVREIATITGISNPTVLKVVDFLLKKELLKPWEGETKKLKSGRKPNLLSINTGKYYALGVIFEGEYLTIGSVDTAGNIQNYIQVKTGGNLEKMLLENIDRMLQIMQKPKEDLVGIGIGMPCIFDSSRQEIVAPLIGIREPMYFGDSIQKISDRYGVELIFDNDLNLEAYGEYSAHREEYGKDLLYISLGTGLGAGMIIDGKVRTGRQNICGEIGYMCFETKNGSREARWVENRINRPALGKKFRLFQEGEEDREGAIAYLSDYLALIINNLIVSVDISEIVLSGTVPEYLGKDLFTETGKRLDEICFRPVKIRERQSILPGVTGAAALAIDKWLKKLFTEE